VLEGLREARVAGFEPIKLNMVVQADVNVDEVSRMVAFAIEQGFVLRLIEPMPVGDTGRASHGVDLSRLGEQLAAQHGLVPQILGQGAGPARYWCSADGRMSLGVITPMSRHFCAHCNRVRLGVDGTLYLCLGQNDQVPLGRMLREGASDAQLCAAIRVGMAAKPERHHFNEQPQQIVRFMAQTGG
jgi:cyclic pyranopterin phosphate synthase